MVSADILCLSHLRWDHVYQRPNHLMSRAARDARVFFMEEPVYDADEPWVERLEREGVHVLVPHVTETRPTVDQMRMLIDRVLVAYGIRAPILWYYTPMALPWTRHLHDCASATVYDCMDHLAGFGGAPPALLQLERELVATVDLLFTGGASLHAAKAPLHDDAHCFPSSVDVAHFRQARDIVRQPSDQAPIDGPRIGYFGVLDERIDWPLLTQLAEGRSDLRFVLVGPLAKVDPSVVPTTRNVHHLGPKAYAELPAYLGGWDVAIMPFARNDATRYISPTKTPEYLAGGRPVVSTSIRDVVTPYGDSGLVRIADEPAAFSAAIDAALTDDLVEHRRRADHFLATTSWDRTWAAMRDRLRAAIARRSRRVAVPAVSPALVPAPVLARSGGRGSRSSASVAATAGRASDA
jgi:UDP-galactopyranose mutase